MFQPLLILAIVAVALRDELSSMLGPPLLGPAPAAAALVVGLLSVVAASGAVIRAASVLLDRHGRVDHVRLAEHAHRTLRLTALLVHLVGVLLLGWVEGVRAIVGDLIAVDEVLCVLPLLLAFTAGWALYYPVERRVREALVFRALDAGMPVYPIPGIARYVLTAWRNQVVFTLAPVALALGWSEGAPRAMEALAWSPPEPWPQVVHGFGVVLVVAAMPLVIRAVSDVGPLAEGPLHARLWALCRQYRVGVRQLLIWRTGGTMLNGAVVGIVPGLRYILLTDALLDHLPTRQIEAVAAHEVGHVRSRHVPWLLLTVLAVLFGSGIGVELALERWTPLRADSGPGGGLVLAVTLIAAFVSLGFVSRRFELQADTFAARHLSKSATGDPAGGVFVPEGVGPMVDALRAVSRMDGVPADRFTWRHGSINGRIRALEGLTGRPLDRAPADRSVRLIKLGVVIVGAAAISAMVWA